MNKFISVISKLYTAIKFILLLFNLFIDFLVVPNQPLEKTTDASSDSKNVNEDSPHQLPDTEIISDISHLQKLGAAIERTLEDYFCRWGTFVAERPVPIMILSLLVSFVLASGLLFRFSVTTDPVDLWVSRSSQARQDMEYFNKHFQYVLMIESGTSVYKCITLRESLILCSYYPYEFSNLST